MVGADGVTRPDDHRTGGAQSAIEEAVDLLALAALPGVGPARVNALVSRFGSAERALLARSDDFRAIAGAAAARARSDHAPRGDIRRRLDDVVARGTTVLTWSSPAYPGELRQLADPPPVLFLHGRATLLDAPCVTIVGARRATGRARDVARQLGRALAARGVTVVSGLALGVDGDAHRGALAGAGATVAVLGTGTDVPYPATHRRLHHRIASEGLLVSEFPPGTTAAPHHFPRRNRILAALAATIVVVEAGPRSGSLITVDHALDLGRDIWAVPGPIDLRGCQGSNRLLADGARALVSIEDFVDEVAPIALAEDGAAESGGGARGTAVLPDDTVEVRALAALAEGPATIDDVASRLTVPVGTVLAALTVLELHGEVERLPGMRFRRAA